MSDVVISKEGEAYHELFCPYLGKIKKWHRKQISEDEARKRGYRECKFCRSVQGIVYKYKKIGKYDVSYDKVDNALCVKTEVGFWKLKWREASQDWQLFHMNHRGWKHFDQTYPAKKLMRGSFHRQDDFRPTTSVGKALSYIENHDLNYKQAEENIKLMPKNTPEQRRHYRNQKKRKTNESIRNVYKLFEELEKEKMK